MISPFLSLLLVWTTLQPAKACGGLFPVVKSSIKQRGEMNVFGVEGNTVTMHVQIQYEGPAEEFGWILPVPFQPKVGIGSDLLFRVLFEETLPKFELSIHKEESLTCSPEAFDAHACNMTGFYDEGTGAPSSSGTYDWEGTIVLEEGSVGPFDFVVLEAAENNPSSVFRWLEDHNYRYNVHPGSYDLLNFYAQTGHVFVALRLRKESSVGEIQPLVVSYNMTQDNDSQEIPEGPNVTEQASLRQAIACLPIQLTSVAAIENTPIEVYILGHARAIPLNFLEIELDDTQVPWLECHANLFDPDCYFNDYRKRFDRAANQLSNHSFVTEYAGPSKDILHGTIEIPVTKANIESSPSILNAINDYSHALPQDPATQELIDLYAYGPWEEGVSYNVSALAHDLEDKVLRPAREAQAFVDQFSYLTRLYARLSPESMTKDPFFAWKPELPPVDNIHRATAVPMCDDEDDKNPLALNITVQDGLDWVEVPATRQRCSGWFSTGTEESKENKSPALQVASWGFAGDAGIVVTPEEDGSFNESRIEEAIRFGDSLVMDQTIPTYVATTKTLQEPDNDSVQGKDTASSDGMNLKSATLMSNNGLLLSFAAYMALIAYYTY